jgi:hypothetical protein
MTWASIASLLVMCALHFVPRRTDIPTSPSRRIPRAVLSRCEWGHDDYSLRVENLPQAPPKPGQLQLHSHQRKTANAQASQCYAGRLSLRPPQTPFARASGSCHRDCAPRKSGRFARGTYRPCTVSFPTVTDFEREFPSTLFCSGYWCGQDETHGGLH